MKLAMPKERVQGQEILQYGTYATSSVRESIPRRMVDRFFAPDCANARKFVTNGEVSKAFGLELFPKDPCAPPSKAITL